MTASCGGCVPLAQTVPADESRGYPAASRRAHPASASRPMSVVVSQTTLIVCRPARISRCFAASVAPFGAAASKRNARRWSAAKPLWAHRHRTPVWLSRVGCSHQFGRASAPTMPQRVHTMRGPNVGTAMWSGQRSALSTASWWHCHQDTASDRTPLARMLPVQPATAGAAPSRYICLRFCFFENPLGTRNESLSGR
jgi:hypothetical protein